MERPSLFFRTASWVGRTYRATRRYLTGSISEIFRGYSRSFLGGSHKYITNDPLEISTIRSGMDFIASAIAGLSIKTEGDTGAEKRILGVLEMNPCGTLCKKDWVYLIVQDLLVHGNAFAYINDRKGILTLEYLTPKGMFCEELQNDNPPFDTKMRYTRWGTEIPAHKLLHFAHRIGAGGGYSRFYRQGVSYANAFPRIMNSANQLDTLHNQIIQNTPSGIIQRTTTGLSDRQMSAQITLLEEQLRNHDSKLLYLGTGDKFIPNTTTPQAIQYLEARDKLNTEIMRSLHLTPAFLNLEDRTTRTIDQETTELVIKCIAPLAQIISDELTFKLLTLKRNSGRIIIDTTTIRRTDLQSARSSAIALVVKGVITRNEARKMIGLPRLEGEEHDGIFGNIADLAPPSVALEYWARKTDTMGLDEKSIDKSIEKSMEDDGNTK